MSVTIPLAPGGALDRNAGAIRQPAAAPPFAMAAAAKLNWLLGRLPAGTICAYRWPSPSASWTGYVHHRTHDNAQRIVVVALIEGTPTQAGTLSFTVAGGAPVTLCTIDSASGDGRFDDDSAWSVVAEAIDLSSTGFVRHEFTTVSLYVHYLVVVELPRARLAEADGDECVEPRDGGYAGVEVGRRITSSDVAGVAALLEQTREARDNSVRHINWSVPTANAWSTNAGAWTNMADAALGTSGFGIPHLSRLIRAAEGSRAYDVQLRTWHTATTAQVRLRSATTGDTADINAPGAEAWGAAASSLLVDCDADDLIYVEGRITAGSGSVYIDGIGSAEQ